MNHFFNHPLVLLAQEAIFGFSLSGLFALVWTETLHAAAVIITGLALTIATHYLKKWLKKVDP